MIATISGNIHRLTPTYAIVEAAGIGYHVNISLNTYSRLSGEKTAFLYSHLHITESAHTLYGFDQEEEKQLFLLLISVSGVGPSTAIIALSSTQPLDLIHLIQTDNEAALKRIKGIGEKTAKRIILELKEKVQKLPTESKNLLKKDNTLEDEALSALLALGFNKSLSEKALQKAVALQNFSNVEELIKEALKLM